MKIYIYIYISIIKYTKFNRYIYLRVYQQNKPEYVTIIKSYIIIKIKNKQYNANKNIYSLLL